MVQTKCNMCVIYPHVGLLFIRTVWTFIVYLLYSVLGAFEHCIVE